MSGHSGLTRRGFAKGLGAATTLAVLGLPRPSLAQNASDMPLHGLSAYGELKYPADFQRFDYAELDAPVGGRMVLSVPSWILNQSPSTFDTLNTFVLQGNAPPRIEKLYDSLMVGSLDEPDALYCALAETVTMSADGNAFTFRLRPEARFANGEPVTAADVAFTYRTLKDVGHPSFVVALQEVSAVEAIDPTSVRISFSGRQTVNAALSTFGVPIVPAAFFEGRDFTATGMDEIPGSGRYRVGRFEAGRYIEYERRDDYWARDLPFARGLDHFQTLRIEFFRDRQAGLQAFKSGLITHREEFTTRAWAVEYTFPAVAEGRVIQRVFDAPNLPKFQCWALNQRRERFADVRVRRAINLCFDFEWTNANMMFGLRTHSDSPFEASDFKAEGVPSADELALLEPMRGQVPDEVFGKVWVQPVSDGSGTDRALLRQASQLFAEAGWTRQGSQLVNQAGEVFRLEYMINDPEQARVYGKMIETLRLLGVAADFRLVDAAQYQDRLNRFDFDMVLAAFSLSPTPTAEGLGLFFASSARDANGTYNFPGTADPAIDALVARAGAATSRAELVTAMRCLDRILRARLDWIPNISAPGRFFAYWNMFRFRETPPEYGFPVESLWWYDEEKARAAGRA